ncbi:MAG: efflux RND transporter periplasmic adaptor subunit [Bacteroidetes bacterium]|nr:efflux RND transporter periplasmic adaptor subunit [Bacteroidota bacterium]MBL6943197.1 efflux RND transporter periplasmic adaptor subunit [Bacteroidales bacterium]
MKKIIYLLIISFIITSCDNNNDKADAYGNFEATEVIVSAQANGQIISFSPEEGIELKQNEIVGLIDTTVLHLNKKLLAQQKVTIASQFSNLSSEIEVQKQQLANTKINQERITNLFKEGAATQKQLDDVNGSVDLIKKQILAVNTKRNSISDQIKGVDIQIEQINDAISKCNISNPVTGTVLVKYAENGEITGIGKPLYKIADLIQMKLKAYISGAQVPNVKIGQQVEVSFDKSKNKNTTVNGTVSWISETAEFTPKTIQTKQERVNLVYAIKITVINNGTIKIGMPGEVRFTN